MSLQESIDANLYLSTAQFISNNDTLELISHLNTVRKVIALHKNLKYTTTYNLLNLILIYTLPDNQPFNLITELAKSLIYKEEEEIVEIEDVELINKSNITNEISLIKTANDLIIDTNSQAQLLGFNYDDDDYSDHKLFHFVRSKLLFLSRYYNDLQDLQLLFSNVEGDEFVQWYNGLIKPFDYYWSHDGNLYHDTILNEYLSSTERQRFEILLKPISRVNNIENWSKFTIIPYLKLHNDFQTLTDYSFNTDFGTIDKYQLWFIIIKLVKENFNFESYQDLIENWLAACYYYSFKEQDLSSIEITKIYDVIKDTLMLFDKPEFSISKNLSLKNIPLDSFQQFYSETNPIFPLFKFSSISFLNNAIDSCQKLYPINKLTLHNYLQFKFDAESFDSTKEIQKLTSNMTSSNYSQLMKSVNIFQKSFIPDEEKNKIDKIILEKLLHSDLFHIVNELYDADKIEIPPTELFNLLLDKFWYSFNQSSNMNEKIGNLSNSKQCLDLLSKLPTEKLEPAQQDEIVKFKHLFKAMNSMKNFKIIVDKKPLTPAKLLSFKSDVLRLITIILEQNAKSYIAFEKLFRITNDLLIYFNLNIDSNYYFNKLKSLCIESALVDDNFQFAYNQSIELFNHLQSNKNNDELWLTFYQVGKFSSPSWLDEPTFKHLDVLVKQREILSLIIKKLNCDANAKIILNQWNLINDKIEKHIILQDADEDDETSYEERHLNNISSMANDIINDATKSTNNAGEKISSLLVNGLGWAIGANR